jgi:hypothetical protein
VKRKHHLGDLDVDGRKTLRWVFRKLDSCGSGRDTIAGYCEHGNELSGSIRGGILDYLSDCQLLKKYSAPWSSVKRIESGLSYSETYSITNTV